MIIILMGVSGSGKTTIGEKLSERLGWRFYEGDDFHPKANIEKMHKGIPLTDEDRAPWLEALSELIGSVDQAHKSAIIACSALKEDYRERLKERAINVKFVFLKGSYDLIEKRITQRHGHFMNPELLKSQFDTLEEPEKVLVIDVSKTPEEIVDLIIKLFDLKHI